MTKESGRRTSRLQGLDSLRGIAAITVVLSHFTYRYSETIRPHRPGLLVGVRNGHFAVDLFFIISGFVIFMTLERSASVFDFAVSRFARLWPPYIACACFTGSLIVLLHFNPINLTVEDAVLNVLMMDKLFGIVAVDPSYWTLTYEVLFYAGAAVTYFGLKVRRMEWACLAWLAVGFIGRASGFDANHLRFGVLLGMDFCQLFVLGMMIYLISQRRATWLTILTALLAYAMSFLGPYYNPGNLALWQFMIMTAIFAVSVWLIAERKLLFLNVWPLLFLGDISYSLYLVHQIAGYWVIRQLEGLGWDPNVSVLVAVLCAIVVATCVRRLVELPAQKAIRNWYRGKAGVNPNRSVLAPVLPEPAAPRFSTP